jgi:hypothetical protein
MDGINRSAAGEEFGAHLHVGPCVVNDGAAALAHYNTDVLAGRTPARIDPTTDGTAGSRLACLPVVW